MKGQWYINASIHFIGFVFISFIHSILFIYNIIHNTNSLNTLQLYIESTIHCINTDKQQKILKECSKGQKCLKRTPQINKNKRKKFQTTFKPNQTRHSQTWHQGKQKIEHQSIVTGNEIWFVHISKISKMFWRFAFF